jgi:hypothetical protein
MKQLPATVFCLFSSTSIWAGAAPFSHRLVPASLASTSDYVYVDSFESRDCSAALACAAPAPGKSCISGQLAEVQTAAPLRAQFNIGLTCSSGAIGGPCDLVLAAYDAIQFASDPHASVPLTSTETIVDGCGRFRISNLQVPGGSGIVAIADDDAPGDDAYAMSATMRGVFPNQSVDGVGLIAAPHTTVASWTTSAGAPFGASTFADVGALLLTFSTNALPASGVTVIRNGATVASSDYYFSDISAQRLSVDSAATATGTDGSALVTASGIASYSGSCGVPSSCSCSLSTTAVIAGVVSYAELICQ